MSYTAKFSTALFMIAAINRPTMSVKTTIVLQSKTDTNDENSENKI